MTPKPRPAALTATSGRRRAVLVVAAAALVCAGAPALASQASPRADAPLGARPAPTSSTAGAAGTVDDEGRPACAPHTEGPTTPGQLAAEQAGLGTVRRVSCLARWRKGTPVSRQAQAEALARAERGVSPLGTKSKTSKSKTRKTTTTTGSGGGDAGLPRLGVRPAGIADIYRLDQTKGAGTTIGIVVAFDNPVAEADLAVYRATFGLPACTTANGCFRKLNQRGGTTPPTADSGWSVETSLDVQAVSASCPLCKIVLVEADSDDLDDIAAAAKIAGGLADVVSHSYGLPEFKGLTSYGSKYYAAPGIPDVVASGDHGYGDALFPAVLPDAIAVGGTKVVKKKGAWVHSAWSGAGSGCSTLVAQPSWQAGAVRNCTMRASSDVSALADTQTGLAVYDTFLDKDSAGWVVIGGTSLAAPLVAGMVALSGDEATLDSAAKFYSATSGLLDVVKGSNGSCTSALCKAKAGWDGPTGLGTPQGLSAF